MTRRRLLAAGLGIAAAAPADNSARIKRLDGSRVTAQHMEARVKALMKAARIPGMCVAILNGGRVVYIGAFGSRDVEKSLPLTVNTIMYGASFTKTAFAYMVMQLVDEGLVDLDRPLFEYLPKPLPEYEKYQDLSDDARWKKLTARICLDHTTGFPNFRFYTESKKLTFNWDPGSKYGYSGEGINLLGFVIETVTGKSTGELMKTRVFDRFGMSRTSMTWRADFEDNCAIGYDENGKPLGHRKRGSPNAAGSMDTTISDWARLASGVFARNGLSKNAWDQMLRPQIRIHSKHQFPTLTQETTDANDAIALSYGLGLGVFQTPVGRAYFKEGHDDGWENHCVWFDHGKTALIVMSNSSNADGVYKELLEYAIGDRWTPWEWEGYVPFNLLRGTRSPISP